MLPGLLPQYVFRRFLLRFAFYAIIAAENTLDIAIQDWLTCVVAEGGNGVGRGWPNARQFGDLRSVLLERSVPLIHDDAGTAMQVARPGIVAKTRPIGHDVFLTGPGQRAERGKPGQEAGVIRNNRRHLCLLQHDFREPDAIGVAAALPRQIVPAARALPFNDGTGK